MAAKKRLNDLALDKLIQVSFDAVKEGVSILDVDLNILYVNKKMEQLYEKTAPLVGKKCYQAYQDRDMPCECCPSLAAIKSGESAVEEVPLLKNGSQVGWLELSASPLKNDQDKVIGVVECVRDITERREAINSAEQVSEWYRAIAEDIPALLTRLTPELRFTFANNAYCRFYNKSLAEIIGRDLFQFIPPENKTLVKEALLSLTPQYPIQIHEHTNETSEGELRWIRWTNRALFDDHNRVLEYLCVGEDITEQKMAEEELRKSERRSRALVDAVPDMLFHYSKEGVYVDAEINNIYRLTAEERHLYKSGLLIGSIITAVLEPEIGTIIMRGISKALETGKLQVIEYNYRADKKQRYFEARMVSTGKKEVISIVRDITEQKRVESDLQYQYQFQKMVADISSTLVNRSVHDLDGAIDHALKLSGEFFGVDRSYVCSFSEDGLTMNNTHEWCAEGIPSMKERNQCFALKNTPWWAEQLRSRKHVYVPDVEALPPDAEQDKIDFRIEGTRSFLTIPLVNEEKVIGIYGFKVTRDKKPLTNHQVAMLKVVAEIIAGAIVKLEAEEALKESEELYRDILATIEEAYYETDLEGNIVFFNEAGLKLYGGYTHEEVNGISYKKLYKDPKAAYEKFNQVFTTGKPDKGLVLEMIRKDGSVFYGEISITLKKDKDGFITGFKGIGKDVTERIEYEERLKYLSMHDHLTGVYNRTYFETELDRLSKSRDYPITIMSSDLDGLKLINDTMGHDAGDKQLQACVAVLKESLRQSDILARVGGDEFCAILLKTEKSLSESIVRRIRKNVKKYNQSNESRPLGISVGIATADHNDIPLKELFKRADDMMYRNKLYSSSSSRSKIVQSLLATLAERDFITGGHARRLEEICHAVGEKIHLPSHQLTDLTLLAQVHDLGKVGIPDQILSKTSSLTEEEWEVMRGHTEKGYRIATASPDLSSVADLILKHHECWDGSGYPFGLKGKDIPVECRIMAIVDAFDAMTEHRPYNDIKTNIEAIEELKKHAGSQFDPELVPVFLSIIEEKGLC